MVAGQWLTVQDVAGLLNVRIETVRRWVRLGELPVLELGGPRSVYRIRPDDLDRFVWRRYRSLSETSAAAPHLSAQDSFELTNRLPDREPNDALSSTVAADRTTNERLRVLVDAIPAVTFREDATEPGSTLYVSREIEALLGYPLSVWREQPRFWLELIHPSDRAAVDAEIACTDATGDPFTMEYRLFARDGRTVWVRCEAVLIPDAHEGKPVWEGVVVDITERKKVEAMLGLRELQQHSVARLGQYALEGIELSTLLHEAVIHVSRSLDVEFAKVFEVLPGGNALVLRAGVGWKEGSSGEVQQPIGQVDATMVPSHCDTQSGYTLLAREAVISQDLAHETRFDGPRMMVEYGVLSGASVIVPGRGRPFGVLGAHSTRRRSFNQDDVFFLQSVANVLASVVARSDVSWLTVADVAEHLQVTEETVRRWIRRSDLPALNLGGPRAGYRVYPSDLERFIGDRLIGM